MCIRDSYNVVDSFDTHANIPAHFAAVDAARTAEKPRALVIASAKNARALSLIHI